MSEEKYRYFIELLADLNEPCSRAEANERRHSQALETITQLRDWLHDNGLEEKVGLLSPTTFGQVQITCEAQVMDKIREEEALPIAAIRQGSLISWARAS